MKKHWINLLIVIAILIVTIVLVFFTSGTDSLIGLLSAIRYEWLAAAFACILAYWMGDALSLYYIIKRFRTDIRFADTASLSLIGAFFNTITPFASGGQPAQIYFMAKRAIPPGEALTYVFLRSLISLIVNVLYSIVIIFFKGGYFAERVPGFFALYVSGFIIYTVLLLTYLLLIFYTEPARRLINALFKLCRRIKFLKKFVKYEEKLDSQFELYKSSSAALKKNIGLFPKVALVQTVRQTFFNSIPFLIFLAAETGKPEWFNMVAANSMVAILSSIIPSPGAAGGAEGAGYVFFGLFFKTVPVIAVLLIWRLVTHYSGMIFGGAAAFAAFRKLRGKTGENGTAEGEETVNS